MIFYPKSPKQNSVMHPLIDQLTWSNLLAGAVLVAGLAL